MEDSGFKVYKNFKTSQKVIDIYAILPTTIGDFGVVVACKNYDKDFKIGVDVLKEMEDVQSSIKASKVTIVSSSYFSEQARNYALRKNIKLVDRDGLLELAKNIRTELPKQHLTTPLMMVERDSILKRSILSTVMMHPIWNILCREEMQILQYIKTLYTVRLMSHVNP